ncbi:unnamed protein product [Haemonchus placei]|uniref:Uncharacterized protein n=1 Tax=Haemonchus placei TaxID=6290 RepID=A0A0N4W020_HAEPC|nr:unnamed protein product [Haemonchus placei]
MVGCSYRIWDLFSTSLPLNVGTIDTFIEKNTTNVNFLNSIFERALVSEDQSLGSLAGTEGQTIPIHSSFDNPYPLLNCTCPPCRYWSARGSGAVNESAPNFDDFQPFASWTSPSVKQFAKFETICGVIVNRWSINHLNYSTSKIEAKAPVKLLNQR